MNVSHQSYQQLVADPFYRKSHRACLAACTILAPLVLLLGFAFDPEVGTPLQGAATIAAWKADSPLLIQWFLFFNVVTPYVYPVSRNLATDSFHDDCIQLSLIMTLCSGRSLHHARFEENS